jgi:pantetheine-phosphate adenylyltransferase
MAKLAVYPGSFDPVTLGHIDIISRAVKLFDEIHIVVVHNPKKNPRFASAERVELIKRSLEEAKINTDHIKVTSLKSGLLVDYCLAVSATALLKGFRNNVDLDYELPMAKVNRDLADIDTVFIPADPEHGLVASSLVRQVADLGGRVERYVPLVVAKALQDKNQEVE